MAVRLLIVDDSPVARKIIRHHLEKIGCRVVGEASNGAQALKLYRELAPQLVTLDVMMPAVEGVDSLATFRAMRHENPKVAILVVSMMPYDHTRDLFLSEGAIGYIVKPFTRFSFGPVWLRLARAFPELENR